VNEVMTKAVARVIPRRIDRTGVFGACSTQELYRIQGRGDVVAVEGGKLVQEAARLQWVYIAFDGTLAIVGGEHACVVDSGGVIGARTALVGDPPTVSVTALTDATFFVTTTREFLGLLHRSPGLGFGIARHLAAEPGAV